MSIVQADALHIWFLLDSGSKRSRIFLSIWSAFQCKCIFCMLCIIFFVISGCSLAPDEAINKFVKEGINSEVTEVKYGKVSCMHCPLFFRFTAKQQIIEELVTYKKMHKIDFIPRQIRLFNGMIQRQVGWWDENTKFEQMDKFAVSYLVKGREPKTVFSFMFVNNDEVYYIFSGAPLKDDLLIDKAMIANTSRVDVLDKCSDIVVGDSTAKYVMDLMKGVHVISGYGNSGEIQVREFSNNPPRYIGFFKKELPHSATQLYGNVCNVKYDKNGIVTKVRNYFISDE